MRGFIVIRQVGVFLGVLVLWAVGDALSLFNRDIIPSPLAVLEAAGVLFGRPELWPTLWYTLRDSLVGVAIAAALGIPVGLLIGIFPKVELSTRIVLDFGRAFPAIALVPVFVLVFGTSHTSKIMLIAIACFFPVVIQTIYGARRLEPTILDTVNSFRIPALMRYRRVVLPAALPYIATGVKLSLSISILVAVGAEILMQVPGIGAQINLARTYNEVPVAIVLTLYAGIMGVALSQLWDWVEGRMLAWHHREGGL